MAQIAGTSGEVQIAGATVAGIKSWILDYVMDALETTDFGDSGHRTYLPGIDSWAGSFEGYKDGAPSAIGAEVALTLKQSGTAGQVYTGQAIMTGCHATVAVDGIVGEAYDFQGTGTLTVATA